MGTTNTSVDLNLGLGAQITRDAAGTGVTDASQPYILENIVEGLAMDVLRRESMIDKICNTNAMRKLTEYGQSVTFRVLNAPSVKAYVINQDMVYDETSGVNFTLTVDNAFYAFPIIDGVDLKQINLPLVQELSRMIADAHKEKEYQVVVADMITSIYGASAMSYLGQTPGTVFYSPTTHTQAASTDRTDSDYIINYFLAAQKAARRLLGKQRGMYALVNGDVWEILAKSDQMTNNISGGSNKGVIEQGNDNGMVIAGFEIIVTDEIPTATYDGQTNIAKCIIGHKNGAAFCRQLMDTKIIEPEKRTGKALRSLDVFGFGLSDSRLMGALPIKVD